MWKRCKNIFLPLLSPNHMSACYLFNFKYLLHSCFLISFSVNTTFDASLSLFTVWFFLMDPRQHSRQGSIIEIGLYFLIPFFSATFPPYHVATHVEGQLTHDLSRKNIVHYGFSTPCTTTTFSVNGYSSFTNILLQWLTETLLQDKSLRKSICCLYASKLGVGYMLCK